MENEDQENGRGLNFTTIGGNNHLYIRRDLKTSSALSGVHSISGHLKRHDKNFSHLALGGGSRRHKTITANAS